MLFRNVPAQPWGCGRHPQIWGQSLCLGTSANHQGWARWGLVCSPLKGYKPQNPRKTAHISASWAAGGFLSDSSQKSGCRRISAAETPKKCKQGTMLIRGILLPVRSGGQRLQIRGILILNRVGSHASLHPPIHPSILSSIRHEYDQVLEGSVPFLAGWRGKGDT